MAPKYSRFLRPKLSESGPVTKVPKAIPIIKVDRTSCALFGLLEVSSFEMSGSAGNSASIDSATVATNIAMSEMNSVVEIRI